MMRPTSSASFNSSLAKVSIDAHPSEQAIIVRYEQTIGNLRGRSATSVDIESKTIQKVISLKELTAQVDIRALSSVVLSKCPWIPSSSRKELEQVLHYLQKRSGQKLTTRSRSSSAVSLDRRQVQTPPMSAEMSKLDEYLECFYSETAAEKNRGALSILELTKIESNLTEMIENETMLGALARVFREDWKKNFDVATNIVRIFVNFSRFSKFHSTLMFHKVGSLCLTAMEHEVKRAESWQVDLRKSDPETARKLRTALRKQANLLAVCVTLLTNLAVDINVELKMVRRDLVSLLMKCLHMSIDSPNALTISTMQFLLKLSIFEENKAVMEQQNIVEKILKLFPITDTDLRKVTVKLLFNLAFDAKNTSKMVESGLVPHMAPLIEEGSKALNVLYLLSCNDDAKAMMAFTDAIQLLMRDVLTGGGSEVTKAVLLNTCIEKRNAQLVCGTDGQGLNLLMELALNSRDLMIAKVVRAIAAHEGPTQELFVGWMPRLLEIGMNEGTDSAEDKAALGLESLGAAAEIRVAPWAKLCEEHNMIPWMKDVLRMEFEEHEELAVMNEKKPLQLQVIIACGTMARQLDAARALIPLIDTFIFVLQSSQIDDEFVVQLLFMFLQMLRHKELADLLMGEDSALGAHIIDLMHDANASVREICDNSLVILGEHSQEWARRIAAERFRWHNAQWLEMVERGAHEFAQPDDDDYGADVIFDQYDDGFDLQEPLF
ncbi:unnamed protein product [Caenorhabditis auriculariae]|uniref:Kinesin-associated protein 3 n=1 Tax=Caenorhabditis auriculariae TaxID=2777116 RepID=A0A8S1GWU2_9PELO|nr:unnamed protein product [Caenorhabditis auriculariae]